MAVILTALLHFTLPSFGAVEQGCESNGVPVQLESLFVWANTVGPDHLIARQGVAGHEGQPWTINLGMLRDSLAEVWVVTSTTGGATSCASAKIQLTPSTSVPPTHREVLVKYFDLSGRRVQRPTRSGIYFRKVEGQRVQKIVVLK